VFTVVAITAEPHRMEAFDDESRVTNSGSNAFVSLAVRTYLSVSPVGRQAVGETRMLWFLAFATGEDLSGTVGATAVPTPAEPPFPADSSSADFVSGAVIALSTELPLR